MLLVSSLLNTRYQIVIPHCQTSQPHSYNKSIVFILLQSQKREKVSKIDEDYFLWLELRYKRYFELQALLGWEWESPGTQKRSWANKGVYPRKLDEQKTTKSNMAFKRLPNLLTRNLEEFYIDHKGDIRSCAMQNPKIFSCVREEFQGKPDDTWRVAWCIKFLRIHRKLN